MYLFLFALAFSTQRNYSKYIHVSTDNSFLLSLSGSPPYGYTTFCSSYLPPGGQLGCLYFFFFTTNKVALNIHVPFCIDICLPFMSGIVGSYGRLCFTFLISFFSILFWNILNTWWSWEYFYSGHLYTHHKILSLTFDVLVYQIPINATNPLSTHQSFFFWCITK